MSLSATKLNPEFSIFYSLTYARVATHVVIVKTSINRDIVASRDFCSHSSETMFCSSAAVIDSRVDCQNYTVARTYGYFTISRRDTGSAHECAADCAAICNTRRYGHPSLQPHCLGRAAAQNRVYERRKEDIPLCKGKESAVHRELRRGRQTGGERGRMLACARGIMNFQIYLLPVSISEASSLYSLNFYAFIVIFNEQTVKQLIEINRDEKEW